MNKIISQRPFSSKPISFEENFAALWRQFLSEVLVRDEVKNIHSWEVVATGKGTLVILVLANISTVRQWEAEDPFLVEEEDTTEYHIGYATVPTPKH